MRSRVSSNLFKVSIVSCCRPFTTPGVSNQPSGSAIIHRCAEDDDFFVHQLIVITEHGFFMTDESLCLDAPGAEDTDEATVRFQACSEGDR